MNKTNLTKKEKKLIRLTVHHTHVDVHPSRPNLFTPSIDSKYKHQNV